MVAYLKSYLKAVNLACRRRLLEGLDLTSTALGLLINLVEHDSGCRPSLAALPLRHGTRALPLLCRLMQVRTIMPLSLYCAQTIPGRQSMPHKLAKLSTYASREV